MEGFMKDLNKCLVISIILLCVVSANAITWTTLDYPALPDYPPLSGISDIDGSNVLGIYGGLYNLDSHTWTAIDLPLTARERFWGISGRNIVGSYMNIEDIDYWQGFVFNLDSQILTTLNFPGGFNTLIRSIDGSNLVGFDRDETAGFLYNLDTNTWTTLNFSGATYTHIYDIDGSNVVGFDDDREGGEHGSFLYNLNSQTWTSLDLPGGAVGISGSNIISYDGKHSFVYNLNSQSLTSLDYPGAIATYAYGIDGDNIVGYYEDASGTTHGFLAVIPEPASAVFLVLGVGLARRFIKKHRG
jgi:hypothetical protein